MKVAVIDGQGGGIGKHITEKIRKELGASIEIIGLGTNSVATSMMLKAGANEGATGESAIIYTVNEVDVVTGTLSLLVANSMLGEFTPAMAAAVSQSIALKVLLPIGRNRVEVIGVQQEPLPHLIDMLVKNLKKYREVGEYV
jgi:NAD(P)-dependent dehydrogenase (short-subunit alcohol dehydrogenase family)